MVEDNPDDAMLTRQALVEASVSCSVEHVTDGLEAIDRLGCATPDSAPASKLPHLILLDLKLPKLGGLGVLEKLRANPATRCVPVVMFTTSTEEKDISDCFGKGANSYVQKPVDYDELLVLMNKVSYYWGKISQSPISD
ncbi:MAG: response regulator [Gammaproteobacteria bacterium]|nr:response regulator [Gammaproteobacteria bacterium]